MAMEIAQILSLVFEQHGQSASMIPPMLLSAAMELQEHLDPVTRQSFLSVPVWQNIVMDDLRIHKHPLYQKAVLFITSSMPSPSSHPPVQPNKDIIANAPAEPRVGPKPTSRPMRIQKKSSKVVESSDSDAIEIIDHVVATDAIPPHIRTDKGQQTVPPGNGDEIAAVEITKGNAIVVQQRPMPKRKQTQPTGGRNSKLAVKDRKGKGKQVQPLVDNVDGDGSAQSHKK
ncbi:uncharacterized protein F5147DRAFT_659135 [Suillus discolor]|uniref:Uncharacterized protein n=1 Tax=Suillus discolor TaxID=1912936 RepID=A0A9P7ESU5_9AGAM|nr:uncharacterized protein F5147DRAFT_659135 [Suillus discolor]KAG2086759.1 hypothetical protein F5147DRAFT_659135 [Suillus discolor]